MLHIRNCVVDPGKIVAVSSILVRCSSDFSMSYKSSEYQADTGTEGRQPPLKSRRCLYTCGFTSFSCSNEEDTRTLEETGNRARFDQMNTPHSSKPIKLDSYVNVPIPSCSHPSTVSSELENNIGALKWSIGKLRNDRTYRIEMSRLPPYHDLPSVKPNITWIQGLPRMILNTSDKYVSLTADILRGTGLSRGECESTVLRREISIEQVEFICDFVISKEYKGLILEYRDGTESITTFYVCVRMACVHYELGCNLDSH